MVCLDVINKKWSPMFELLNIFNAFLPQLLLYPNSYDPLNPEAASLLVKYPKLYTIKIKEYMKKYASSEMPEENKSLNKNDKDMKGIDEEELSITSEIEGSS